jgi:hypothetical protein
MSKAMLAYMMKRAMDEGNYDQRRSRTHADFGLFSVMP